MTVGSDYWHDRKDSIYLHAARLICYKVSPNPAAVIDIGSNGTPILEWYRQRADLMVSIDLKNPYRANGINSIAADFLEHQPKIKFSLATCFQVLEHVQDAETFAQKILAISDMAVVSVPYKWPAGVCKWHVHDPVDEEKLFSWFKKKPVYGYLATEIDGIQRLVCVYKGSSK